MKAGKKPRKKTKKSKNIRYVLPIIAIVIVAIVLVLILSSNHTSKSRILTPQPHETVLSFNGFVVANQKINNSFILPAYKYEAFEIPVAANSSSYYAGTSFLYSVNANTSVNAVLMDKEQFNAFNSTKNFTDNILLQNGKHSINEFLSNKSGDYYLVVFGSSQVSSVNVQLNSTTDLYSNNSELTPGFYRIINQSTYSVQMPLTMNGSYGTFLISAVANASFNLEVYDNSTNSIAFYSPKITVTNMSGTQVNNSFVYELNLSKGQYTLKIIKSSKSPLLLSTVYLYLPKAVNPLIENSNSYARGLASYGVENNSGKLTSYSIETPALMGFAHINSLYSYYSSQFGQSHQISLQLNGVLTVTNNNGNKFNYWVQDTADINSQTRTIYFEDNVWNFSYYPIHPFYLTNQSIKGDGAVYYSNTSSQAFYADSTNSSYFDFPLTFALIETAYVRNGTGVNINTCYQPLQGNVYNSNVLNPEIGCYDNITISDPNVESAEFYITGANYPSFSLPQFYDAEFVFGGGYNGSHSIIQSINAQLGLYYYNESTTSYVQFPSYYPIGGDTGETANNLNINYNGLYASATAGNDNIDYLGQSNSFMPIINVNNVNFTDQINFTNLNEVQNYSGGNLTGFSTSAGTYYTDDIISYDPFSQYTCILTSIKSTTPNLYLASENITLPYTFYSDSTVPWDFQIFSSPFYNYTGNLNILQNWQCS